MSRQRLQALYRSATEAERSAGLNWYDGAFVDIKALSYSLELSHGVIAGLVAVLSPNNTWARNIGDVGRLVEAFRDGLEPRDVSCSTYTSNVTKGFNILATGEVFPWLSGPKVERFYLNLNGDLGPATIDSHAINAWFGERVTGANLPGVKKSIIDRIRADYVACASARGLFPAEFQAVIWVVHRRRVNAGLVAGYERGV